MKKLYVFTLLLMLSFSAFAQSTTDTVFIPQAQALEISDIVNADTSVTDYRVYALDRGAKYFIVNAFEINSSCKFISIGDEDLAPAMLASAIRADDSQEEWFFKFIQTDIDVELNDLYLLSMRPDGKTLGWSRAVWVGADGVNLTMRDIVLDGWTEAGIKVTSKNYTLDVQDCHFRNFIHATSYFGGQPFLSDALPYKSIKFINNTFFACNSYLFCVRGLGEEAIFEHNTIFDGVVNPFLIRHADNLSMKNNMFYNAHAYAGIPSQVIGGWFFNWDSTTTGLYRIHRNTTYGGEDVSGPEALNDTAAGLIFDAAAWENVASNNGYYISSDVRDAITGWNDTTTYYDSVTTFSGTKELMKRELAMPTWISPFSQSNVDALTDNNDPAYAPGVGHDGNIFGQDPGFNAEVTGHNAELINYIYEIAGSAFDNLGWQYEMTYPIQWPLPENLAYTNAALVNAGDDGFALGDLNWFPEQKADWITGVEEVSSAIADEYTLSQNYPNPFNPTTTINFSVPKQATVSMKVFNVLGQQVSELVNKEMSAGSYKVSFDASKLTSGVYFYTIQAGDFTATKKMMLLK